MEKNKIRNFNCTQDNKALPKKSLVKKNKMILFDELDTMIDSYDHHMSFN
jgi:hypothetical protein